MKNQSFKASFEGKNKLSNLSRWLGGGSTWSKHQAQSASLTSEVGLQYLKGFPSWCGVCMAIPGGGGGIVTPLTGSEVGPSKRRTKRGVRGDSASRAKSKRRRHRKRRAAAKAALLAKLAALEAQAEASRLARQALLRSEPRREDRPRGFPTGSQTYATSNWGAHTREALSVPMGDVLRHAGNGAPRFCAFCNRSTSRSGMKPTLCLACMRYPSGARGRL